MNIERLEIIAEWLEAGAPHRDGQGFNMETWSKKDHTDYAGAKCGTVMCIGGAANQFFGEGTAGLAMVDEPGVGIEILGLTRKQTVALFYPYVLGALSSRNWSSITPQHAARVIRHLIATDEVDWAGQADA